MAYVSPLIEGRMSKAKQQETLYDASNEPPAAPFNPSYIPPPHSAHSSMSSGVGVNVNVDVVGNANNNRNDNYAPFLDEQYEPGHDDADDDEQNEGKENASCGSSCVLVFLWLFIFGGLP